MKKIYSLALSVIVLLVGLSSSAQVVINEVYGGGGNTGAVYKNDFIELYNNSNAAVDITGWSVQYGSATGTAAWQLTTLTGSIPSKGYYLIQESAGSCATRTSSGRILS